MQITIVNEVFSLDDLNHSSKTQKRVLGNDPQYRYLLSYLEHSFKSNLLCFTATNDKIKIFENDKATNVSKPKAFRGCKVLSLTP